MVNVSWYGGGSTQFQYWPLNNANINSQPFIISDLHDTPMGYGSVLERYFLGSTGEFCIEIVLLKNPGQAEVSELDAG